ncbi:MAG: hypothetical protein GXP14_02525 [Gammaproteobacteria bacterium]|nr:hypothetical protein [Gammaproteobacteria bacterium]
MKLSRARQQSVMKNLIEAELIRNPSNTSEWFIMLHKKTGKSFMLANDDDSIIVSSDMEQLLSVVKSLGFRQAIVHT